MSEFLKNEQVITKIILAILVPAGMGNAVHKNRPSHGIAFNLKGEKQYVFDNGKVFTVKENDFIYLPKNSNYEVDDIEKGDTYCINFLTLNDTQYSPFVMHATNVDKILNSYKTAEKAWTRAKEGREYCVIGELYKILYEMKKADSLPYLPEKRQAILQPAIDYIHKNYTSELISAQYLSELCSVSYDYFRRLFEKFYGTSPIKYINALKIKRAKELLQSNLYSVSEVAYASGFSDLSHFSRFFKENVGVSPAEYSEQ